MDFAYDVAYRFRNDEILLNVSNTKSLKATEAAALSASFGQNPVLSFSAVKCNNSRRPDFELKEVRQGHEVALATRCVVHW